MNDQQLLDTVAVHLISQGVKSYNYANESCAYRGDGGLKCAIGVLISEEHYYEGLEGYGASNDGVVKAISKSIGANISMRTRQMLQDLQTIHDTEPPEVWGERIKALAESLKLHVPIGIDHEIRNRAEARQEAMPRNQKEKLS